MAPKDVLNIRQGCGGAVQVAQLWKAQLPGLEAAAQALNIRQPFVGERKQPNEKDRDPTAIIAKTMSLPILGSQAENSAS